MEKVSLSVKKDSDLYNLIIPQEVERKIRYLCNKISKVEWSGVLFYTHSGSYEEGNLEIKCVDILLMDIGSSVYTEFDVSPDIVNYMAVHPELLDCQIGLIHSHNNMDTFFSGTDMETLREEGKDRNHFVSLIVNNAGVYTAAITRKLTTKSTSNITFTYKTFDDVEKKGVTSEESVEEIISYNNLNIIKEGESVNMFQEIDERFKEISSNKENKETVILSPKYPKHWSQETLFEDEIDEYKPKRLRVNISDDTIKSITLQLITGSIAIDNTSKIDPMKWANQMIKVFGKRFNNIHSFSEWVELFADFIICQAIPKDCSIEEEDECVNIICDKVYTTLDKLPSNVYIDTIKNTLIQWIQH